MSLPSNVNPRLQELSPYVPGKPVEQLERELGVENAVKLASNENTRGPSRLVREFLASQGTDLNRYPDPSGFELKTRLADFLEVEFEQITLGNGSNDVLELVARVALEPGYEAIVDEHCFVVYPLAIAAAHGVQVTVKSTNWGHDLDAMVAAITDRTRLIYIANPNNPTGTWLSRNKLEAFLERVSSNVWVVLDEAYFEYAIDKEGFPDGISLTRNYPNLIITRTFSKAYGLAGLRIGYAVSSPQFADFLNRIRQPFNANSCALTAAALALSDQNYIQESVTMNDEGMRSLEQACSRLRLPYIPSAGNFLSIETGANSAELYNRLLHEGVIVRPIANYGMPEHLRVTIGNRDENTLFVDALEVCLPNV